MNTRKAIRYVAPLAIPLIAIIFVWNVIVHGTIQHPGKSTYQSRCAQCHGDNGEGIKALTPPLLKADLPVQQFDSLPCWIKFGMNHPIKVNGVEYDQPMYPNEVDEIQTANVINFICQEFLKYDTTVNSIWVKEHWKACQ